jgi:hypothetical protein
MCLRREDAMTNSVTVESPESCEQRCQQMERCAKMTYHHDTKLCITGSQAAIFYDDTNNTNKEKGNFFICFIFRPFIAILFSLLKLIIPEEYWWYLLF